MPKGSSGEVYAVDLCDGCRAEVLPEGFRACSWSVDMHRAPAAGMIERASADPRADRIRRRKARKVNLRELTKEIGIVGAIRASLDARQVARIQANAGAPREVEENCPRCLAKRRRIA